MLFLCRALPLLQLTTISPRGMHFAIDIYISLRLTYTNAVAKPFFKVFVSFLGIALLISFIAKYGQGDQLVPDMTPTAVEQPLVNEACSSWWDAKNLTLFKSEPGWDDGYIFGGKFWSDIVLIEVPFRFTKIAKVNPEFQPLADRAQEMADKFLEYPTSEIRAYGTQIENFCNKNDKTTTEEYHKHYCEILGEEAKYYDPSCV